MASISRNAVTPLELLLEACYFPEKAISKVNKIPKLQEAEMADALDNRAVLWDQMIYEWAVDDGQVDLKKVLSPKADDLYEVDMLEAYAALEEISHFLPLEVSVPMARMKRRVRPMREWKGQRCRLVERTGWLPLELTGEATVEDPNGPPVDDINEAFLSSHPVLKSPKVGQVWIRIAEEGIRFLNSDLVQTLTVYARLGRERHNRLKENLARQNPDLTEDELAILNSHLNSQWYDLLGMMPRTLKKGRARKLTEDQRQKLAVWGVRELKRMIFHPEKPPVTLAGEKASKGSREAQKVFVSYSHADIKWLERLTKMLSPLERNQVVDVWYDQKIKPSQKWRDEIDTALASAKIAVLLVSDNFLASNFIATNELPFFLAAAERKDVTLIWVALAHCMFEQTPLNDVQCANAPDRPLDSFRNPSARNKEIKNICRSIYEHAAAASTNKATKLATARVAKNKPKPKAKLA